MPDIFYWLIFFFRFRLAGGGGAKKRAFLISAEKTNSKTSYVNQQSALNLKIFHHFSKILDRTITFNSVTFKNTQSEPKKYIIFYSTKQIIFRVGR